MKAEFELTLDEEHRPVIKFKHHDKSNSLDQKTLAVFVEAAKKNGLVLKERSQYGDMEGNSWSEYIIRTE